MSQKQIGTQFWPQFSEQGSAIVAEKTWKRPGYKCAVGCRKSESERYERLHSAFTTFWGDASRLIKLDKSEPLLFSQPANLNIKLHMFEKLLLLILTNSFSSLKKWKLRRNGCDRIVWVTGAREISVVGGNRGRGCGFSGTLWPHTFLHLSSLLRKGKNTILLILLVEICISGSNVIGII